MPLLFRLRPLAGVLVAVVVLMSASPVVVPASAAEPGSEVTARPSSSFLDSVGINIHAAYNDTAYGNTDRLVRLLADLGVQRVRDGLKKDRPDTYALYRRLAATGVRSSLVLGDPRARWGSPTPSEAVRLLTGPLAGTFDLLEGANEFDCSGDPSWMSLTKAHQKELARLLDREAQLRDVPLLSPSFCDLGHRARYGAEPNADAGNMHPYPGGHLPERRIRDEVAMLASLTGGRPQYATEAGYHNALVGEPGHPGVDEVTAAPYLLRMFLENFRLGIVRTYAYELMDPHSEPARQDQERHFGIVRADGSPKPAYTALRNLLTSLRDQPSAAATPPHRVRLDGAPDTARSLVLQRRDGSTDVVVWNALPVTSAVVPVRVLAGVRSSALLTSPVESAASTPVGTGDSFVVPLSPLPQVLRLTAVAPVAVVGPPAEQVPAAGSATAAPPGRSTGPAAGEPASPGPAATEPASAGPAAAEPPSAGPAAGEPASAGPATTGAAGPASPPVTVPARPAALRSWWRLGERRGAVAADSSGLGNAGRYAAAQLGVQGMTSDQDRAARFRGGAAVVGRVRSTAPSSFSLSFGFRTSSRVGGRLVGFGNALGGTSTSYDRHVYLTDDGRLVLGVLGAARQAQVVVTQRRWNDGRWHRVTATLGGERLSLSVDGVVQASLDGVVPGTAYAGTWRVGADRLTGWPLQPGRGLVVDVDELKTYDGVLPPASGRTARAA